MGNIKAKELSKLGFIDNVARSMAIDLVAKNCKHFSTEEICKLLQDIKRCPEHYKQDAVWGKLARTILPDKQSVVDYELRESPIPYYIYGAENIDDLSKKQMEISMKLPITVAGALMPDGCAGYGLPIGGILATTEDVVIPYAVGKDIGCRMSLTILDYQINAF